MKWYISGPMRNKPKLNHDTFHAVEAAFEAQHKKDTTINPAKNFGGDTTRKVEEYLTLDIRQVLESDGLILLPGWEKSEGACLEVSVGLATGKKFQLAIWEDADVPGWAFSGELTHAEVKQLRKDSSPRAEVLDTAKEYVLGDRNNQYGPPTQDFDRTAGMLNALGYRGPDGRLLVGRDFGVIQICGKLSRMVWSPRKKDHYDDGAGYFACAWECTVEEGKDA